jgi:drug/metabolite transporter (DMT)-like permease
MALSENAKGVAVMVAGMAAFTLNDACMKAATQSLPLMQAIALRGSLATLFLLAFAALTGGLALPRGRPDRGLLGLRTLAEVAATISFLAALMHMQLANLSAILQALPLAVTLAAALVFGEPIGWRRLTAIAVGFAGVMLIVRPGSEGFDRWSVLGLVSVACVVVRDLATRRMTAALPTATVALAAAVSVAAMGWAGVGLAGAWVPVEAREAWLLLAASAALFGGYLLIVKAMRCGDVGLVAPFRYSALLWAILFGWIGFAALPDGWTLAGAALVIGSGTFTILRERRLNRAPRG